MLGRKGAVQISFHIYNPACSAFLTLEVLAGKAQHAEKMPAIEHLYHSQNAENSWNKAVEWFKWFWTS